MEGGPRGSDMCVNPSSVQSTFSLRPRVGTWTWAVHVVFHVFKDLSYREVSVLQKGSG